jgi:aminopeptidase-like protein
LTAVRETLSSADRVSIEIIEQTGALVLEEGNSLGLLNLYAEVVRENQLPYLAIYKDPSGGLHLALNTFQLPTQPSLEQYKALIDIMLRYGASTYEDFEAQKERGKNAIVLSAALPPSTNVGALIADIGAVFAQDVS